MIQNQNVVERTNTRLAEIDEVALSVNESTGLSWLWAFLFGPIYFAVHGFWGRALLVFLLSFIIIGFLIAPFLAYPAWKGRARERAERLILIDRAGSR